MGAFANYKSNSECNFYCLTETIVGAEKGIRITMASTQPRAGYINWNVVLLNLRFQMFEGTITITTSRRNFT